jgi:ribosome production factor 1
VQAVLPCAEYYKRQGFPLKKIVSFASNRDFSDLLVFNEDRKEVRGGDGGHLGKWGWV